MRRSSSSVALRGTRRYPVIALALVSGALTVVGPLTVILPAQQPAPDLILANGKIITVDERFTLAQSVAIRGDRIVAVGTDADVARLASPVTRGSTCEGVPSFPA